MTTQKLDNGSWVDCNKDDLIDGDVYRLSVGNGGWQQQTYRLKVSPTEYNTSGEQITINGNPPTGKSSVYFAGVGESISIQSNIVDDTDAAQTQIDSTSLGYPPVLVVPVMKYANKQVVDEVYFQVTIVNGVITTSGSLPSAGNWKMTTARVNEALKAINADWQFSDAGANFIIS